MQCPSVVDYGNAASTTLIESKNQLLLIKIHAMYFYTCYTRTINISDGYLFCSEFTDFVLFCFKQKDTLLHTTLMRKECIGAAYS